MPFSHPVYLVKKGHLDKKSKKNALGIGKQTEQQIIQILISHIRKPSLFFFFLCFFLASLVTIT